MPFSFLLSLIFIQLPQKLSTLNASLQYDNLTVVLLALVIFLDLALLIFFYSCELLSRIYYSFSFLIFLSNFFFFFVFK